MPGSFSFRLSHYMGESDIYNIGPQPSFAASCCIQITRKHDADVFFYATVTLISATFTLGKSITRSLWLEYTFSATTYSIFYQIAGMFFFWAPWILLIVDQLLKAKTRCFFLNGKNVIIHVELNKICLLLVTSFFDWLLCQNALGYTAH